MAYSFVNIGWQLTALGDSSYYIVGFTQWLSKKILAIHC
jgi:hypothetical protein